MAPITPDQRGPLAGPVVLRRFGDHMSESDFRRDSDEVSWLGDGYKADVGPPKSVRQGPCLDHRLCAGFGSNPTSLSRSPASRSPAHVLALRGEAAQGRDPLTDRRRWGRGRDPGSRTNPAEGMSFSTKTPTDPNVETRTRWQAQYTSHTPL